MKYLTFLLITLLSLASSCQKEDMPPTDGHKNIFRCKVNGVEWTPHCISDFFGCSAIDCQYYKGSGTIEFHVLQQYEGHLTDQYISIYKYQAISGDNLIQKTSGYEYSDHAKVSPCGYYNLDTSKIRRLTILNIDTINHLIEGTFEFTAYDRNISCEDTVSITDGYFDVEYRF
ncbi:MAG: hypothetical protein K9I85_13085 [Saprospiraceae bacterium]|nr:hypothetical protein [Saprospiraceae bacterium]